ncbi:MAG TPA: DUF2510 domain-containing protein [Acidimicrobiales bacterium]|nr:DUF2510 domain-containing protein [Acidimicrobiales bacterium]
MTTPQGSWEPDPFGRNQYRWFDGTAWTDQVSNDSVVSVDPPDPGGAPAPGAAPPPGSEPTAAMAPVGGAPVPPAAAAPAAPVAAAGGGGSGNKVPLILGAVAVVALIGAGAFFFLGGDDDGISGDERASLIAEITADGWTEDQAGCLLDALVDELGADEVRVLSQNDSDADLGSEQAAAVFAAYERCDLDLFGPGDAGGDDDPVIVDDEDDTADGSGDGSGDDQGSDGAGGDATTGDDGDTGSDGDAGGAVGDGDLPDGFLELFTEGLLAGGEFTEDQARCFAEALTSLEGLDLEGAGDDPDAFAESLESDPTIFFALFGAFAECGIPLDGLGGFGEGLGGGFGGGGSGYGDDPALDALWDACEAGDGQACDDLYLRTPIGSEYEEFGATCGGRFDFLEVDCSSEL